MNKKHAYLIIAHHQFELLELLCRFIANTMIYEISAMILAE